MDERRAVKTLSRMEPRTPCAATARFVLLCAYASRVPLSPPVRS